MVQLTRPKWRAAIVGTAVLTSFVLVPSAPAAARENDRNDAPKIVASGLNNPRHIRWSDGALYVAEAGIGGTGNDCIVTEQGRACYGATGSIARIKHSRTSRVVTALPSVAPEGGANALGPSDIQVRGKRYTVAIGFGADPQLRAQLPRAAQKLATVSRGRFGRFGVSVVADIARYEAAVNPDGDEHDTNPVALLKRGQRSYVVDAGGNALLRYRQNGSVRAAAVFPAVNGVDAVPTAAAYGPDGAIYVSQLTGFPFTVGAANIWRVVPGRAPTRYATGLTNVTDLAFGKDGSLYVVQIADQGLLAPSPTGSVVKIRPDGRRRTLVNGLTAPYGITLHHKSAYITVCSRCPGGGQVLRVPLR